MEEWVGDVRSAIASRAAEFFAALSHSAFRVVDSLCVSSFGSVWSNVQKSYLGKPRPRT
jgi:Mlc titration factor MtfA (ptsG expression regulator)